MGKEITGIICILFTEILFTKFDAYNFRYINLHGNVQILNCWAQKSWQTNNRCFTTTVLDVSVVSPPPSRHLSFDKVILIFYFGPMQAVQVKLKNSLHQFSSIISSSFERIRWQTNALCNAIYYKSMCCSSVKAKLFDTEQKLSSHRCGHRELFMNKSHINTTYFLFWA